MSNRYSSALFHLYKIEFEVVDLIGLQDELETILNEPNCIFHGIVGISPGECRKRPKFSHEEIPDIFHFGFWSVLKPQRPFPQRVLPFAPALLDSVLELGNKRLILNRLINCKVRSI